MNHELRKTLIILIISALLLPSFSFAQTDKVSVPENFDEAKNIGQKAWCIIKEELPQRIERIWQEEVLPVWQKMYNWFLEKIWLKVRSWFETNFYPLIKEEVEKRKPVVEEEFQKEKQELKEEAPRVGQSLWERFKELIK